MQTTHSTRDLLCLSLVLLTCQFGASVVLAQQPLPVSKGVYRLPYADGTVVSISNDHLTHSPTRNRLDLTGAGSPNTVVAAAAGWIRRIVEANDTFCPNACRATATNPVENDCDGDGTPDHCMAQSLACAGYGGASGNCCERHVPSAVICLAGPIAQPACSTFCAGVSPNNNFVWMEHPNGEWTKYTHMLRGSIGQGTDNNGNPGAGRFEGEFVAAGTPLGIEGDVGIATGPHVHFEVAFPDFIAGGTVNDYVSNGGFLVGDGIVDDVDGDGSDDVNRQDRVPVFCQVDFPVTLGDTNTAGPCDDLCNAPMPDLSGTTITAGNVFYNQVPDTMGNPRGDFVAEANSGVAIRAGNRITLSPGFHAELNSYFSASIGACDTPGGSGE